MGRRLPEEERVAFLSQDSFERCSTDTALDKYKITLQSSHTLPSRLRAWLCSRPRAIRRTVTRNPIHSLAVVAKHFLACLAVVLVATPILIPSYTRLPPRYRLLQKRCAGPIIMAGCANPFQEKIFIAVSLYDQEGHLASGRWGEQMLELIQMLGPDNTFLSVYENDSPLGKAPLEALKERVPCRHEIVFDDSVSLEGFGNVTLPDGTVRMKRLSYLSEIRNRALRPLDRSADNGTGMVGFDKILFMNDVFFNTVDAAQLLFNTNVDDDTGRTDYLSVCSLDYSAPFKFYDVYAQRDAEGYSNGAPVFPIFTTAGQGLSRADMLAQRDAVRVTSCWSGMVAMEARYVQNLQPTLPSASFDSIGSHVIDPDHPVPVRAPVRFRYESEVFIDACECCLFLADVSTAASRDPAATHTGVFVNPYVRVAYDPWVLTWLHRAKRWERLLVLPHRLISWFAGLPRNNPYREVAEGEPFVEEVWINGDGKHAGGWELVNRTGRAGLFCAVREMQLLKTEARTGDKNWASVAIPPGQHLWFPT